MFLPAGVVHTTFVQSSGTHKPGMAATLWAGREFGQFLKRPATKSVYSLAELRVRIPNPRTSNALCDITGDAIDPCCGF